MAKQNEYMEKAVNTLFELGADAKKRQEYEAREFTVKVIELKSEGMSAEQIAMELDLPLVYVQRLVK